MKKLGLVFFLVCSLYAQNPPTQVGGLYDALAFNYGYEHVAPIKILSGNSSTGLRTITTNVGQIVLPDGKFVNSPITTNTPITVGNPLNSETITPTAVSCTAQSCTITATFANVHGVNDPIFSASFGFYEALNYVHTVGGSVIINGAWTAAGGTQITIQNAPILTNVTILDNRVGVVPNAPTLINWHAAIGSALAGTADATVLVLSDSTSWGEGSIGWINNTTPTRFAWPALLATKMNANGIPASSSMGVDYTSGTGAFNTEWSLTGGWTTFRHGLGSFSWGTTSAGNLVYTPSTGYSLDTFDVYYVCSPSQGAATITATGGTPLSLNLTSGCSDTGNNGIGKATVTAGSASISNSVTVAWVSGTIAGISAIEGRLAATHMVRIANASQPGIGADSQNAAEAFNGIAFIARYAPTICIINYGINDANSTFFSVLSVFQSNLQNVINACTLSGSAILMSMFPTEKSALPTVYANETLYQALFKSLSSTQKLPFIDLWSRYGGTWPAILAYNDEHPNQASYYDQSNFVFPYLVF